MNTENTNVTGSSKGSPVERYTRDHIHAACEGGHDDDVPQQLVDATDYDALATRCERLEAALQAVRSMESLAIHGTCQSTGETFADMIDAALSGRAGDNGNG